ncbi:tail fiber assembly protein [Photorhabdus tasmaniensis]
MISGTVKSGLADKDLLKSSQIEGTKQQQATLLRQTNETLSLLQDFVDLEVATEAEEAELKTKPVNPALSRSDHPFPLYPTQSLHRFFRPGDIWRCCNINPIK